MRLYVLIEQHNVYMNTVSYVLGDQAPAVEILLGGLGTVVPLTPYSTDLNNYRYCADKSLILIPTVCGGGDSEVAQCYSQC